MVLTPYADQAETALAQVDPRHQKAGGFRRKRVLTITLFTSNDDKTFLLHRQLPHSQGSSRTNRELRTGPNRGKWIS